MARLSFEMGRLHPTNIQYGNGLSINIYYLLSTGFLPTWPIVLSTILPYATHGIRVTVRLRCFAVHAYNAVTVTRCDQRGSTWSTHTDTRRTKLNGVGHTTIITALITKRRRRRRPERSNTLNAVAADNGNSRNHRLAVQNATTIVR